MQTNKIKTFDDNLTTKPQTEFQRPGLKDVADEILEDSRKAPEQYLDEVVVPKGGE